jgi:MFS family permease
LIQQFDVRICICVGAVISCLALTSLAWVETVWQLYSVYLFFGVGFSASNLIPVTTLITRWFHKKRAMALSIASTGLSLGGVLITPLCAVLVESIGLSRAAPIMGGMFLIGVIPVSVIWLRPSPASMGLLADGDKEAPGSINSEPEQSRLGNSIPATGTKMMSSGVSFTDAYRGRFFWGVSIAYIFLMMAQVGGISHQYGLARELMSEAQTAVVVAILPIASIVGRLIGGWVVEQVPIRTFAIVMMILQMLSLGLLAGGFTVLSLCIGLALFGITVGNLLMLQPLLIAHAFGVKDYAKIFSVSNLMSSWGTAAGPAILGVAYVANQDLYSIPYLIASAAGLLGLLFFQGGGAVRAKCGTVRAR